MKSGWIKATAIILGICAGIYCIYAIVLCSQLFKRKPEMMFLAIVIAVISYAVIFMLIGAIYRIGTLTDYVEYMENKSIQTEVKLERDIGELQKKVEQLEMKVNGMNSPVNDTGTQPTRRCPNCGNEIGEDYIFCTQCGTRI